MFVFFPFKLSSRGEAMDELDGTDGEIDENDIKKPGTLGSLLIRLVALR